MFGGEVEPCINGRVVTVGSYFGLDVTGIVDRLVQDGFIVRSQRNGDRRTSFVRLTAKGHAAFVEMATAHERWITELLGGVKARDAEHLSTKLKSFRSDWEGDT